MKQKPIFAEMPLNAQHVMRAAIRIWIEHTKIDFSDPIEDAVDGILKLIDLGYARACCDGTEGGPPILAFAQQKTRQNLQYQI